MVAQFVKDLSLSNVQMSVNIGHKQVFEKNTFLAWFCLVVQGWWTIMDKGSDLF